MEILLSITAAFLATMTLMPIIIKLFRSIDLLDIPDKRKIHRESTPSLGGIAIFSGIIFSLLLSMSFVDLASQKYFIGASLLIFLLGVRDDLSSLMARHKLVIQIFAAVLVVYFGGWKIEGLNGLFGVDTFPYGLNGIFTIFVIVVLTNAFNLIDGIDGLAGSIALLITLFFGWYFMSAGLLVNAIIAISTAGAVLAFLLFNWFPSKVFMGDTGSMTLGFIISTLMVQFLTVPDSISFGLGLVSPVSLCIALLILPVYDTLRVFFIRFYTRKNPLAPDRNHIHHVLLKLGMNHGQSSVILVTFNLAVLSFALLFQHLGDTVLILSIFSSTVLLGVLLDYKVMKKEAARTARLISSEVKLSKSA
jgi:UDP-N-acetylmuramyl pentapeptide phosphotransferase/UDP-N-acetylglucosamine-1-phosphate transferase